MSQLQGKEPPKAALLTGRFVQLEKVNAGVHGPGFEAHLCGPQNAHLWEYIPFGAPSDAAMLIGILEMMQANLGWHSYAMRDRARDEIMGTVSLMRIRPEHASAEIGCVVFGSALQRTPAASEAVYLLGQYLFEDLGYRRYEWKCDNLNEASRRAAARFGFAYEGVFRNDMIVKGRSRDTAWFAMTDDDWLRLKPAYERWLAPANFDDAGGQKLSLSELTRGLSGA